MADVVEIGTKLSRMPFPSPHRDPTWAYDLNELRADFERAYAEPADDAERMAMRLLLSLYVPASDDAQAERALLHNFFAIRRAFRQHLSDNPAVSGGK